MKSIINTLYITTVNFKLGLQYSTLWLYQYSVPLYYNVVYSVVHYRCNVLVSTLYAATVHFKGTVVYCAAVYIYTKAVQPFFLINKSFMP